MALFTLSAPEQTTLLDLYAFTPAEARVAALLREGKSSREIKLILKIGTNTLKFHLAHIFEKTGTSRQAELVRLLILGPQPQEP
jgi:DNA-binding CsgD family transcriptional regulator